MSWLKEYLQNTLFLLDDFDPDLKNPSERFMWEQLSSNALFFSPFCIITDSLKYFGSMYLEFLYQAGCQPRNIVEPRGTSPSLSLSLVRDEQAFDQVKHLGSRSQICMIYPTPDKPLKALEFVAPIHPSPKVFGKYELKPEGLRLFKKAGLKDTGGVVCENVKQLERFFDDHQGKVIFKREHWRPIIPHRKNDLKKQQLEGAIIEPLLPFKDVICVHSLSWKGHHKFLFANRQYTKDFRYFGMNSPVPPSLLEKAANYACRILEQTDGFEGFANIDFGVLEGDLIPVDFNPRIGPSLPLLFFLNHLEVQGNIITRTTFNLIPLNVPTLGTLWNDPFFPKFDIKKKKGVLLYAPFGYYSNSVSSMYYVVVADTERDIVKLETLLFRVIRKHNQMQKSTA